MAERPLSYWWLLALGKTIRAAMKIADEHDGAVSGAVEVTVAADEPEETSDG